jgi:hypothetical protein
VVTVVVVHGTPVVSAVLVLVVMQSSVPLTDVQVA